MGFEPTPSVPLDIQMAVAAANGGTLITDISKYSALRKFGRNAAISSTLETLWTPGGRWAPPPSGAQTITFTSDASGDDGSGTPLTGARTILVDGLDASGAIQTETVTLNGTANVTTSASFLRVNRSFVLTAGSTGFNEGTITGTWTTDATTAIQIAEPISGQGDGQSQHCVYSIPAGYLFVALNLRYGIETTKVGEFRIYTHERSSGVRRCIGMLDGVTSYVPQSRLMPPTVVPGGYDIEVTAKVSTGAAIANAAFEGWLVNLS